MKTSTKRVSLVAAALLVASVTLHTIAQEHNTVPYFQERAGWRVLFDGKTTDGWRNYKQEGVSDGWKVEDGELKRVGKGAGDLISKERFQSFDMSIEYKISKGGNSGLMFHVTEEGESPWNTGPEIQIQDNVDGKDPQKSGWLYQLYKAEKDLTKPAGEWNELRLIVTSKKCEVWMNGTPYFSFIKGSDDWNEKVAKSKFAAFPLFGKSNDGHICLQDHGNEVAFRNIRIRPLADQFWPKK